MRKLRCVSLIACSFFVTTGAAWGFPSNPPSPRPREGGQQQEAQPSKPKQDASKPERGTDETPVVVKVLPPEGAKAEAEQTRHHEEKKAFYDRLIAYSTVALSVITLFLAGYTGLLWRATVKLGRDAVATSERQAGEMKESLAVASRAADATAAAAKAAEIQAAHLQASLEIGSLAAKATQAAADAATASVDIARGQWEDLKRSINIAQATADAAKLSADAAINAERPHMLVSELKLHGLKQPPNEAGQIVIRAAYKFENYGRSPAWLKRLTITITASPAALPEYGEVTGLRQVVGVNGTYFSIRPVEVFRLPPETVEHFLHGRVHMFAFGFLEYSDTFGRTHKTAFIYQFLLADADESVSFHPTGPDAYWDYT